MLARRVHESLRFKRGDDPKQALDVGKDRSEVTFTPQEKERLIKYTYDYLDIISQFQSLELGLETGSLIEEILDEMEADLNIDYTRFHNDKLDALVELVHDALENFIRNEILNK